MPCANWRMGKSMHLALQTSSTTPLRFVPVTNHQSLTSTCGRLGTDGLNKVERQVGRKVHSHNTETGCFPTHPGVLHDRIDLLRSSQCLILLKVSPFNSTTTVYASNQFVLFREWGLFFFPNQLSHVFLVPCC